MVGRPVVSRRGGHRGVGQIRADRALDSAPVVRVQGVRAESDNQQFWTVPGERDERRRGRKTITVTEPDPDEFELYDLTLDPFEERNFAHPTVADDASRSLQQKMLGLLVKELERKRLTPALGERPGYRPPATD